MTGTETPNRRVVLGGVVLMRVFCGMNVGVTVAAAAGNGLATRSAVRRTGGALREYFVCGMNEELLPTVAA